MSGKIWLADAAGRCRRSASQTDKISSVQPYRLYRFLTDLEDVLTAGADAAEQRARIIALVRFFLSQCDWLTLAAPDPHPETGWGILTLYDEPDFPLTVQVVAWAPGVVSPIHNHACWGLVALLQGQEKNQFWHRVNPDSPEIQTTQDLGLEPGDLLYFHPETIHRVEALGAEPTLSFNLYGETDYERRFEFDPDGGTAQLF